LTSVGKKELNFAFGSFWGLGDNSGLGVVDGILRVLGTMKKRFWLYRYG
jgi:hypothetical protein